MLNQGAADAHTERGSDSNHSSERPGGKVESSGSSRSVFDDENRDDPKDGRPVSEQMCLDVQF